MSFEIFLFLDGELKVKFRILGIKCGIITYWEEIKKGREMMGFSGKDIIDFLFPELQIIKTIKEEGFICRRKNKKETTFNK